MIEARFRHRATTDSAAHYHSEVAHCIGGLPWLWGENSVQLPFECDGESGACDLTPFLRKGLRGAISYSARFGSLAKDKAVFDDVLTIRIDELSIKYREFVNAVFEPLVFCFQAYRAAIVHDLDLDLDDYEQIVDRSRQTGQDVDGRDTVFRIHPVNFFDNELCKRAFGRSCDELAAALLGDVERVRATDSGLLLIVTSDFVDRQHLTPLHHHVMSHLGIDAEVPR